MPWIPYSYGALRVYCEQNQFIKENYSWEPPYFISSPPDVFVPHIEEGSIVCFSMYLWNHDAHEEIARQIKSKLSSVTIIYGGPSIPNNESALNYKYAADILVHGEGEEVLEKILLAMLGAGDFSTISNMTVLNKSLGYTGFRGYIRQPITQLLSPYLQGYFDKIFEQKIYNGTEVIALWEKERGCPYSCSFCDWPWTGSRIRYRPLDQIMQEISFFSEKKVGDIYLCDANFGLWDKDLDITREIVRLKKETGYPRALIYSNAKRSDDNVRRIARMLADADMIWGTTLSVQSLHAPTLKAIKRVNIAANRFESFSAEYSNDRIGVYTEVILPLPLETKETFLKGIGHILQAGNHEDLRMFEFFFLPNAPNSLPDFVEKHGLVIKKKPLNLLSKRNFNSESVDIVVQTKDMTIQDWVFCYGFAELVQALHNGVYTRYLAIFLHRTLDLPYEKFYEDLILFFLNKIKSNVGDIFRRLYRLIEDFALRDDIPTVHKVIYHEDIRASLSAYGEERMGWFPYQYTWLMLNESIDPFYAEISEYLSTHYKVSSNEWSDLVSFQKSLILTSTYDPHLGKMQAVNYNWFQFFFDQSKLKFQPSTYFYKDQSMGPSRRYKLWRNMPLPKFAQAAVGLAYPFSKLRHFSHQPDCMDIIYQDLISNSPEL